MKILFVIHMLEFADHIALAFLSAIAKELNHSTYFCTLDHNDLNVMVDSIKPDIVAYSVNILGYHAIVEAHKEAKKRHKFISIMGGPHPTVSPYTFPESGMDAYCIGEGEYAFRDFLIKVQQGQSYDDVENLMTKKKTNPVRPLIKNLDELPIADRDLVLSNSYLKGTGKKTFYATRGCPFKCAYCCNSYYHEIYQGKGPMARRFSVERIIREIEHVKSRYRTDFIKFGDDLFVMKNDEWLQEFAEKYSQRVGVPFNCYLRFDSVDDGLLSLLKKAGCYSVHLSVDSTSKHVREKILKRQMRDVNILENLKKIRRHGIKTLVNYMLAVPESTLEDDLNTIELSRKAGVVYSSYGTTVPMERTELFKYCVDRKLIDPQTHKGDMTGCFKKSTLTCFNEKEKNIRYNIFLIGALVARLPLPLYKFGMVLIKMIPPNQIFKKIRKVFHRYNIMRVIYRIPAGS